MQPSQFRLTNDAGGSSVIREDYSYNYDGSLAVLTDLDDTAGSNPPSTLRYLSRAFSYDNVGRVTSGSGTHGLIPFSQNYGYDAFGNMSSRSGSYYNYTGQVAQSDTTTYTNNRRSVWNYDADGRVTGNPASSTDDAHSLSYDAAGRVVTNIDYAPSTTITYGSGYDGDGQLAFESSQFYSYSASDAYTNNRRDGWGYDAEGNLTSNLNRQYSYDAAGRMIFISGGNLNQYFDGDGQRVKTTEPNVATYYVRSTVLGGQVVAELDGTGNKQRGFIYVGGRVLAEEAQNGSVGFVHEEPAGFSIRKTHSVYGNAYELNELDPLRAEVEAEDPYLSDPDYTGRGEGGPLYPGYGNITDPRGGCTLDGVYSLCDWIERGFETGSISLQVIFSNGQQKVYDTQNFGVGLYGFWIADSGRRTDKRPTPINALVDEHDIILTNTEEDALGHWQLFSVNFAPQNPGRNVQDFKKEVYGKYGTDINRCLGEVFGKDYANKFGRKRTETIANSPRINLSENSRQLGKRSGDVPQALGTPDARIGPNGTIRLANDYWRNPAVSSETLARGYVHELGNVLSQRIALDPYAYGDPKGIGKSFNDTDTGAKFEKCVFGNVDF